MVILLFSTTAFADNSQKEVATRGYVVNNLSVSVFGWSYTTIGPYSVPSYVNAIAIRLNKQINLNYLSAQTGMQDGIHPLELEYGFEEINPPYYYYWFDMPTNLGTVTFQIANGTPNPIGYIAGIVY